MWEAFNIEELIAGYFIPWKNPWFGFFFKNIPLGMPLKVWNGLLCQNSLITKRQEMNTTMSEMKNAVDEINNRWDNADRNLSEFEGRAIKDTQNEIGKRKRNFKENEKSIYEL